jgi:hypothetical protein
MLSWPAVDVMLALILMLLCAFSVRLALPPEDLAMALFTVMSPAWAPPPEVSDDHAGAGVQRRFDRRRGDVRWRSCRRGIGTVGAIGDRIGSGRLDELAGPVDDDVPGIEQPGAAGRAGNVRGAGNVEVAFA